MMTVAELIEELSRWPLTAEVTVQVSVTHGSRPHQDYTHEADPSAITYSRGCVIVTLNGSVDVD